MVNYRRNFIKGGTYFFTVTLSNRQSTLLVDEIDLLREAIAEVHNNKPFTIIAMVVLPEHLHCIWQLPDGDENYPIRWRLIKSRFTQKVKKNNASVVMNKRGEHNIWQRRYWEHTIRNEKDLSQHIDYIHYNPVKHGLVTVVSDWPYSSFHRYVKSGKLPLNWGCAIDLRNVIQCGE